MIDFLTLPSSKDIPSHSLLVINLAGEFELAKAYSPNFEFYFSLWPCTYGHVCATRTSQAFVRVSDSSIEQGDMLTVGDFAGTVRRTEDGEKALAYARSSIHTTTNVKLVLADLI